MTKAEAYYELVRTFHEYLYDCEFNDFVANIVASFQRYGYHPENCTTIMHNALLDACKDIRPEGE
ncbi:hypothetical protein ES703_121882 [subsurface metagenome]